VSDELPGQLPLFEPVVEHTQDVTWEAYEPLCRECGTACTSSKECVEISGLYDRYGED
jgi:hypothetical protein